MTKPNQKSITTSPFILVDGSSYLFRAFYALPGLLTSQGQATGAVYGVINMLRKLLNQYNPEYLVVVFDAKGKTFRKDLYPTYKANRIAMPSDLQTQVPLLYEVIMAMGLPLLIREGVEADDVIATLAEKAKLLSMPILISTSDKDLAQIVDARIHLVNTMSDTFLDPVGVEKKFGVRPDQMIDYLALVGDSSDNIPGIPGVGPKTACKWLHLYESIEGIIQNIDNIPGKVGITLKEHLSNLKLFQELVTVKKDIIIDDPLEHFKIKPKHYEKLIEMFSELEFKNWLSDILNENPIEKEVKKTHYRNILTETAFLDWLNQLNQSTVFAFDTETTSKNALRAELVGLSFSHKENEAVYIPLAHDYAGAPKQLNRDWVLEQLQPIFIDSTKILVGQNIKYDMEVLKKYGVEFTATIQDTLLESYILNSSTSRHDLETLALRYLGKKLISYEEIAGTGKDQRLFNAIDIDTAGVYAAEDADVTLQLHHHLKSLLEEKENLQHVFQNIEMPLIPVLAKMELKGVKIDAELLKSQSKEIGKTIKDIEKQVFRIACCEFNICSPKQLQTVLYATLKLPILRKTPGGQPSTSEDVLVELAHDYELPKLILEHRTLSKLQSTYTDKLPLEINAKTGRIHTSFNQTVTSTGRLSSNNPNLQNIPIRSLEGRRIRKAFICPEGYKLISSDYSQIELRIIAHISQDSGLLRAFSQGLDIHQATAAEVFNIPFAEVTHDQRRSAKTINFGLLYGMSSFGLGKQLGISRELAQQYMDLYFTRYPNVKSYMQSICEQAKVQGYVETLFGRRIYVQDIHSANLQRRRAAERAAINAPMQGTAADIIKLAMIKLDQWISANKKEVHMILQVHDELVFEVKEEVIPEALKNIQYCMESVLELSVPLKVDIHVGNNWDEAH